jgi:drug/metabolite transporter (DMT)-like permease
VSSVALAGPSAGPSRAKIVAAFIAVYIIWGSTYLAISYAVETVPPFLMAGARFLVAGVILYVWARLRGATRPKGINWRASLIVGALLLLGGNGMVSWAEQTVPSSLAALLISTVPLWMSVIEWLRPRGQRPSIPVALGIVLGFIGVGVLFGPGLLSGGSSVDLVATGVVIAASLSWAAGSLYSRSAPLSASAPLSNGMEMIAGGVLLFILGLATGETGQLRLDRVSLPSALGLLYLIVFGSIVAFSAYTFMLKSAPVSLVSTYAYVNPIVAVLLGVAFNGESLTQTTLIAAAIIILAVIVITTFRGRRSAKVKVAPAEPASSPLAEPAPVAEIDAPAPVDDFAISRPS